MGSFALLHVFVWLVERLRCCAAADFVRVCMFMCVCGRVCAWNARVWLCDCVNACGCAVVCVCLCLFMRLRVRVGVHA